MRVYRVSKTKYARDLNGTGAKLYGGRWNTMGTPCIYTSESRALAVLEYSVNINIDFMPRGLSVCVFGVHDDLVHTVAVEDLPDHWEDAPAPLATKKMGSELLRSHSILKIPSIVIPDEYNYILNPLAQQDSFKLIEVKDFIFDVRMD